MVDGAYTHAFLALLFTYFQAALKPLTLTFLFYPPPLNYAHHLNPKHPLTQALSQWAI